MLICMCSISLHICWCDLFTCKDMRHIYIYICHVHVMSQQTCTKACCSQCQKNKFSGHSIVLHTGSHADAHHASDCRLDAVKVLYPPMIGFPTWQRSQAVWNPPIASRSTDGLSHTSHGNPWPNEWRKLRRLRTGQPETQIQSYHWVPSSHVFRDQRFWLVTNPDAWNTNS